MPAGVYNGTFGSTVVVRICDGADETAGYGVPDGSVVCAFASFAGICVKIKLSKRSHTSCFYFFAMPCHFPLSQIERAPQYLKYPYDSLLLFCLMQVCFSQLLQCSKSFRIADSHLRKHLAVYINACKFQTMHEFSQQGHLRTCGNKFGEVS